MSARAPLEILIAGGGPVGATAACLLHDAGYRVGLVDAARARGARPELTARTYAIAPAAASILDAIGAWPAIDPGRRGVCVSMDVWDAGGSGHIAFHAADIGVAALAYVVEHDDLMDALVAARRARPAIEEHAGEVTAINFSRAPLAVTLGTGVTLATSLVVGADGPHSRVRELAGVTVSERDYVQRAVVATVRTAQPHAGIARQWFLADGPLALLPLADPRGSALIWSTTPEVATWAEHCTDHDFCRRLGTATARALGDLEVSGPRASFALRRLHAERYCGPGFALIGDAAHVIHPLAGQGLNLGLFDAAALAETLGDAAACGRRLSANAVRRYARWRRGENLAMLYACDGLDRLFRNPYPIIAWLRAAGLNATDAIGPLKTWLTGRAAGLVGDLPRLARAR